MSQPFKRALGPFDATMIVIGGIIGSGIFINPYIVAQRLDSSTLVIGAWVAGAAIALIGALAYSELGAMLPTAGGQYVYLRDAYHPLVAFLYGWALLFMIESGAMAAVAMTFAEYAVRLVTDQRQASALVGPGGIRAVAIGAIVYVTINVAYLKAVGLGGLAASTTPASDSARLLFGAAGDRFVTAAIAISTFGFLNLCVLAPTRVYYAMAADRAFFPQVAKLHPKYQTPSLAIVLQSAWAIALTLTGSYGQLLDYVVFADWIFFGLTVGSFFIFRRTMPDAVRPFRAWGYPVTPALFVLAAIAIVLSVIRVSPMQSAIRALLMLAGVPAFYYWTTSAKATAVKKRS
ncbi:MAG: amino acid permease [Vicinamibacterales bacterium]